MSTTIFADRINVIIGCIVGALSYVLGDHWFVFVFLFLLNWGDFLTRWLAARVTKTESSAKGLVGIIKKLSYWIMVMIGFGMSAVFIEFGEIIGIDLGVTSIIGWLVLGTLIINEIRSILENLVEAEVPVPKVLTKGLAIANQTLASAEDKLFPDPEDVTADGGNKKN